MFFGDWLRRSEMLSPNKSALTDAVNDNPPVTYREWSRQANQFPGLFQDGLETRKGDRASTCAINRVKYLKIPFARSKLAAILHVINRRSTTRELDWENPSTVCYAGGATALPKDSPQDGSQLGR